MKREYERLREYGKTRECKIRRNRERFEGNNECQEKEKRLKEGICCHKKNC